jgi:glycosyltransferase involved in cell wall biosynthesis
MPPVRVLHVVGQMNRGGLETWLMHVLRHVDRDRVRMDFLVTREPPGEYDDEIRSRGSSVVVARGLPSNPALFARRVLSALRSRGPYGPYDVVHSHLNHFSGFVLALARGAAVPVRIAHSHTDTSSLDAPASLRRRWYLKAMDAALQRCATLGLAVSAEAAASLFGPRWRDDARFRVLRCGLDFGPFSVAPDAAVRGDMGVPSDALVFGHVGRFDENKNQGFLVRVLAAALARDARAHLLLVGGGPLRATVEGEAARLGVRERVAFAGVRADVPRVLRASDVFLFPSLHEGLPLVGLEAQAAGLPIVSSDRVTREVVVIPELFTWVSPLESPERWAEAALAAVARRVAPDRAVARLEQSEFSLARSISGLLHAYGAAA